VILNLSSNAFSGPLPTVDCTKNPQFVTLDLHSNLLSGQLTTALEPTLLTCTYLSLVDFSHNLLTGPVPRGLLSLPAGGQQLQVRLQGNKLSGPLEGPSEGENCSGLQVFQAWGNALTGRIPRRSRGAPPSTSWTSHTTNSRVLSRGPWGLCRGWPRCACLQTHSTAPSPCPSSPL